MIKQVGTKWYVFAIDNQRIRLSSGFATEAEAIAYLAIYTNAGDPIVGR